MILEQLQIFINDHFDHELNFDSQEFIQCLDCEETFELPEGSGVNILDETFVVIEESSGIASGIIRYTIDLRYGMVVV